MMKWIKKLIKPVVTHPPIATFFCRLLLHVDNHIDRWTNELLMYTNQGVHPKHRLMSYSSFFLNHIDASDRVLDIGCGRGTVANTLAQKAIQVIGIDFNKKNIDYAQSHYSRSNLRFIQGDALVNLPSQRFDIIILSSVLEHIEDRTAFLKKLPMLGSRLLIRVPLITRDWLPLLKREWGIDYRLDDTHYVEYVEDEFKQEITQAGWCVTEWNIRFGEIWAVVDYAETIDTSKAGSHIKEKVSL